MRIVYWLRRRYYRLKHLFVTRKRVFSMLRRHKVPSRSGKRDFSRTASKTHWKNVRPRPMRGGIRL